MNGHRDGWMNDGWTSGGATWIFVVIAVLLLALLVVGVTKLSQK
jgi:hypothetical protein